MCKHTETIMPNTYLQFEQRCGHPPDCIYYPADGGSVCEWCEQVRTLEGQAIEWHAWPDEKPLIMDWYLVEHTGVYPRFRIAEYRQGSFPVALEQLMVRWAELPAPSGGE